MYFLLHNLFKNDVALKKKCFEGTEVNTEIKMKIRNYSCKNIKFFRHDEKNMVIDAAKTDSEVK